VRRGEFWLEDFHREDGKGAEGVFFTAKTGRAPRLRIVRLAGTATRVFSIRFGEPAAGAAGCWRGRKTFILPRRRKFGGMALEHPWLAAWPLALLPEPVPGIAGKVERWDTNEGDGLDAEDAMALSRLLKETLEDGTVREY
jgi:hypothetical protein